MSLTYETLLGMTRDHTLFEYAQHVVRWNDIARKARGGAYTDKDLQWSFVKEEFDETLAAMREGDRVEVVDGACDMFVVASYALYLDNRNNTSSSYCDLEHTCAYQREEAFSLVALEQAVYESKNRYVALKQIVALLFRLDIPLAYNMKEVLASNDTKYPTIEQLRAAYPECGELTDVELLQHEASAIAERSEGRYSDVVFVKDGDQHVFLDGNGKIMKPITFRKPKIIV